MDSVNSLLGPVVLYSARAESDYGATFVSETIHEALGYSPEDFTENPNFWVDNIHPKDRDRVLGRTPTLMKRGWLIESYRFRHSDGIYRTMRDESRLVRNGKPVTEVMGYWLEAVDQPETRTITPRGDIVLEVQADIPGVAKRGDHILIRPGHPRFAVVSHHLSEPELARLIKHGLSHKTFKHLSLLE